MMYGYNLCEQRFTAVFNFNKTGEQKNIRKKKGNGNGKAIIKTNKLKG